MNGSVVMKKKLFQWILILALCVILIPALTTQADAATVAEGTCGDNLTWTFDEATGTLCFAIRVINIPDEHKDTTLVYSLYFIYENDAGEQEIYYPGAWGDSYNRVANAAL